jgi:hypothetical protein
VVAANAHFADKNLSFFSHILIIKETKGKVKGDGQDIEKST